MSDRTEDLKDILDAKVGADYEISDEDKKNIYKTSLALVANPDYLKAEKSFFDMRTKLIQCQRELYHNHRALFKVDVDKLTDHQILSADDNMLNTLEAHLSPQEKLKWDEIGNLTMDALTKEDNILRTACKNGKAENFIFLIGDMIHDCYSPNKENNLQSVLDQHQFLKPTDAYAVQSVQEPAVQGITVTKGVRLLS